MPHPGSLSLSSPINNRKSISQQHSTKMTKLTFLLIALLFIAHTCCASKWQEQESCSEKLQKVNLKQCKKHIMEKIEGDNDDDDDADVLTTMRGRINYLRKRGKEGDDEEDEERMQKCCNEMSELTSSTCQCRALQKIMESQSEKLDKKEKLQMEMELMKLAMKCRFGPMIGCDLRSED